MRERIAMAVAGALLMGVASPGAAQEGPRDGFFFLEEMNKAAVMLLEEGVLSEPLARRIADAVAQVGKDALQPGASRVAGYLQVEQSLIDVAGPDATRIHSGRSRQDIGATNTRMFQRDQVLATFTAMNDSREVLLNYAERHARVIVPAYTWGVQAQPVTLGHYLLAFTEAFERDAERLKEAYDGRLNRSPLGVAVVRTSSFPVNRMRLAELLGFDGVVENAYGANQVTPVGVGAELSSIAVSSALTLSSLVQDIHTQYHQNRPWLVLKDEAVGRQQQHATEAQSHAPCQPAVQCESHRR